METEEEKERGRTTWTVRKEMESANLVLASDLQATMAHMNELAIPCELDL